MFCQNYCFQINVIALRFVLDFSCQAPNATNIMDVSTVRLSGGFVNSSESHHLACLNGAGGTFYVASTRSDEECTLLSFLTVSNDDSDGECKAVTVIHEQSIVNSLTVLSMVRNAAVAADSILMEPTSIGSDMCIGSVLMSESVILARELLTADPSMVENVLTITSGKIDINKKSLIYQPTSLHLESVDLDIDATSTVTFGCMMSANGHEWASLVGSVRQILGPAECDVWESMMNYTLPTGVFISSSNITTIGQVISQRVVGRGDDVNVVGEIGVPEDFQLSSCFSNISVQNVTCGSLYEGEAHLEDLIGIINSTNDVMLVARHSVTVQSDASVEASHIAFCSNEIYILDNANLSTYGRGCPANQGIGRGVAPQNSNSLYGGGGGGFGGEGGDGGENNPGGSSYALRRKTYSAGSGGGAADDSVDGFHSSGGGFIFLAGFSILDHNGNIISNGKGGTSNSGGGSGGMVYLYTEFLHGNGSISVEGGGGGNSGGGGGGGGHIEIDSGGESAKYDFSGSIQALGGSADSIQETYPYPYEGQAGYITWPHCPPGSGNDYSTYTICYACPVGYYSEGGDGECLVCSNKPGGSDYTETGQASSDCAYECDSGRQGEQCYTSFDYFLNYVGGMTVFVILVSASLFVLVVPLLLIRVKKSTSSKNRYSQRKQKHGLLLFSRDNTSIMASFLNNDEEEEETASPPDNTLPTSLLMPSVEDSNLSCKYMYIFTDF